MTLIYILKCPETGRVRYVGKTNRLKHRVSVHLSQARAGLRNRNAHWLASLDKRGLTPTVEVLHRVGPNIEWQVMERFFIASCTAFGIELTNGTTGGEGVIILEQDRERIRLARKAGITAEVRAKKSASLKATWARKREEWIASMKLAANKPERKAELTIAARLPRSAEAKARQAEGNRVAAAARAAARSGFV